MDTARKKILSTVIFTSFVVCSLLLQPLSAVFAISAITHTSQTDFKKGTVSDSIEINATPGDISLRENAQTLTDTSKEDFDKGYSPNATVGVTDNPNSSLELGDAFSYTAFDAPLIGSGVARTVAVDISKNILYIATSLSGLMVYDTKGTVLQSDDELLYSYNTSSTPALPNNNAFDVVFADETDMVYVSVFGAGVSAIDTKGTLVQSDDELVITYSQTSTPEIAQNLIYSIAYDAYSNLLYAASFGGGVSVVNTQGTVDESDDSAVITYTTISSPALPSNGVRVVKVDEVTHLVYLSTSGGLVVINTQANTDPGDDTIQFTYTSSSSPSIVYTSVTNSFIDHSSDILYVSTLEGLSVIDTKGTNTAADDTLEATYSLTSTPAIFDYTALWSFYYPTTQMLYIGTSSGVIVIDTQGTSSQLDDVLAHIYNKNSAPSLFHEYSYNYYFDSINSLLYVGSEMNMGVINLNADLVKSGSYRGVSQKIDTTPVGNLTWTGAKPSGTGISLQYRLGDSNAAYLNEFDDNDNSEFLGDEYGWGNTFTDSVESAGTLKVSNVLNPSVSVKYGDVAYFWLDVGTPPPIGSRITVKMRINSDTREDSTSGIYVFNNDWYEDSFKHLANNQWGYFSFTSSYVVNNLGFQISYVDGTWNDGSDSIEIDWVKAEKPNSAWGSWSSACTNQYSCPINQSDLVGKTWIQYQLNLTTNNTAVTPNVDSVTYGAGYRDSGSYISPVLNADSSSQWQELTADDNVPVGTDITYWTRTGDTSTINSHWSDWEEVTTQINSPDAKYLQYKAILTSSDDSQTPVIHSISVQYSPLPEETVVDDNGGSTTDENTDNDSDGQEPVDTPVDDGVDTPTPTPVAKVASVMIKILAPDGSPLISSPVTVAGVQYSTDSNGYLTLTNIEVGNYKIVTKIDGKQYVLGVSISESDEGGTKQVQAKDQATILPTATDNNNTRYIFLGIIILVIISAIGFVIYITNKKDRLEQ